MNYLGVPGRNPLADNRTGLKHSHCQASARQGVTTGEADGPRPDDHGIEIEIAHAPELTQAGTYANREPRSRVAYLHFGQ